MAYDFTPSQYLQAAIGSLPVAEPYTFSVWFYPDVINALQGLIGYFNNTVADKMVTLAIDTDATVRFWKRDAGGTAVSTTNTATATKWHHAAARNVADDSYFVYLDGDTTNKGTGVASNSDPAGLNVVAVGAFRDSTPLQYYNGRIGEIAIWNRDIGEAAVVQLAKGFSPLFWRNGLVAHWMLHNNAKDYVGGYDFTTATGTVFHASPPIFHMAPPFALGKVTTVATGTIAQALALFEQSLTANHPIANPPGFNATSVSREYHALVEFTLDGTTLRYADEDIVILTDNTTGNPYEGRMLRTGTIHKELGSMVEPKERLSSIELQLDNRDLQLAYHFRDYEWANTNADIWIGEGRGKTEYTNIFPGKVVHPNGLRWDEEYAYVTIADRRLKERRNLPLRTFNTTLYPNLEPKSRGKVIPIWYGTWYSTTEGGLAVPAVCTDTKALNFKICDHGVKAFQRYLKNAAALDASEVKDVSLAAGTFSLSGVTYNATNDIISVNGAGIHTGNGTVKENPAIILQDLYTSWLGLTTTDLNLTAFASMAADTIEYPFRRFIDGDLSSETVVSELLNDSQVDMRFVGGKYSPKFRSLDLESTRSDMQEADVIFDSSSEKARVFSVEKDPSRYYANRIKMAYRYSPIDSRYQQVYTFNATTEQETMNGVVERDWDTNWHFKQQTAELRVGRESLQFAGEPVSIDVMLGNRALLLNLADQIDLTYSIYSQKALSIRSIDLDLQELTSTIRGQDIAILSGVGEWTTDVADDWNDADTSERESQGFWSEDTGYVSATDASSLLASRWY